MRDEGRGTKDAGIGFELGLFCIIEKRPEDRGERTEDRRCKTEDGFAVGREAR